MELTSLNDVILDRSFNLQRQLYLEIVKKIVKAELKPGLKLPASRQLAKDLSISRNTVISTYEQLIDEGFLQSRRGSGVYVNKYLETFALEYTPNIKLSIQSLPKLSQYAQTVGCIPYQHPNNFPFSPGLSAIDEFPMKIWQQLVRRHSGRSILCGYNDIQGYAPLREALASYLAHSRGVKCHSEQIIITQGAQQALTLVSQALLDKNDQVIIEEPGYVQAKKIFSASKANLLTAELSQESLDVPSLSDVRYRNAKLLYFTPTHQYPMGGTLSAKDRLNLLIWAEKNKVWLIEDDYDSEFHFTQKSVSAVQGIAENAPIIYMGSFSKTIFANIRLGYLVVPNEVINQFVKIKSIMHGESPMLYQAVMTDFILEGHYTRHLRRMRTSYKEKWQHFCDLLEQLYPRCKVIAKSAGMHLVLSIPEVNDIKLKKYLLGHGYATSSLSSYYYGANKQTGLVIGFVNTNSEQRQNLVHLVKRFLEENC